MMEQPPDGGSPPSPQAPDEAPAPPAGYAPPPPPPAAPARGSSLRTIIVAGVLVAVIVIGLVGYAAVGYAFAQTRISNADKALNAVISHQNQLNDTFKAIDTNFTSLSTSANFNPTQAKGVVDQFVATSQGAGRTIDQDDTSLASAGDGLNEQRWLTVVSRGNLDHESARITHARKALSNARTVAGDYVLDGQFLQSFMNLLIDLDKLDSQASSSDFTGAQATLTTMKGDADKAVQLSSAPGLPPEMHALMVDMKTLTTDFGALLSAAQAGDDAAVTSAEQTLQADVNKISAYNFDTLGAQIDAFYKPLVDGFNSEMSAATS